MPPTLETIGATGWENNQNTGLEEVQDIRDIWEQVWC